MSNKLPDISKQDGVTVITLGPAFENLDELELDDLRDVILDASKSADPPVVLLDMPHTKFFGSSFIEILFRVWNRMNAQEGGAFAISGLTPYCREVLEVTHLDQLWGLFDTREEALTALAKK